MSNKDKSVRPWDLLLTKERALQEVQEKRLETCLGCKHFIKLTKQCMKCGCFMSGKVKLPEAFCPIGLWGPATELEKHTLPKI